MKVVILFLALFSISSILATDQQQMSTIEKILNEFSTKSKKDLFKVWHLVFKKTYSLSTEYAKQRFRVFKKNLKEIEAFNAQGHSHQKGVGPFTDLFPQEFEEKFLMTEAASNEIEDYIENVDPNENDETNEVNGIKSDDDDDDLTKRFLNDLESNDELENVSRFKAIDHTKKLQAPLNSKKDCRASYAFSAVASAEYAINSKNNTKKLVSLSEQQLIDCKFDDGCKKGNPIIALFHIKREGLEDNSAYPYTGKVGDCQYSKDKVSARIEKVVICKPKKHHKEVLEGRRKWRLCGPRRTYRFLSKGVGVVFLDGKILHNYKKGIIEHETRKCHRPNFSAALVGYGVDEKTKKPYWLLRASLGADFGEKGHFRVAVKSARHACFIELITAIALSDKKTGIDYFDL